MPPCRDASGMPQVHTQTVIAALERNFGGNSAEEFHTIIATFLQHLKRACGADSFPQPRDDMFRNTLDVLEESLADHHPSGEHFGNQQANLSSVAARPILIIDSTGHTHIHTVLHTQTKISSLSNTGPLGGLHLCFIEFIIRQIEGISVQAPSV